ncbi:MAG: hypothetical protein HY302_03700 [Opitutae bacterium]|nr:hypothetical protein [Opitutae bacterium]
MRPASLLKEALRSGTVAAAAMIPAGLLFQRFGFDVGRYGPKVATLLVGGPPAPVVLLLLHFVIGWIFALPLLVALVRFPRLAAQPVGAGAAYGLSFYLGANSLALPLFFGDPLPWLGGVRLVGPSLLIHLVYGISLGLTARNFAARASPRA